MKESHLIQRVAVFVFCFAAVLSSAQTAPQEPLALPEETVRVERAPRVFRQPAADRALGVATNSNLTGTNGELLLEPPSTGVVLRAIGTTTPIAFETNGAERMRIFESGKVSIGSTATDGQLSLYSFENGVRPLYALLQVNLPATGSATNQGVWGEIRGDVASGITHNGGLSGVVGQAHNYGPGTVVMTAGLRGITGYRGSAPGTVTTSYGALLQVERGVGTITTGYGVYMTDIQATNDYGVFQAGADDTNYFAGSVGVGTNTPDANAKLHVVGNILATGTITATTVIGAIFQDVAEWVPATSDMAPGTVVVLNPGRPNEVMTSMREYDTTVAGVVSAQPGIILGEAGEAKEQIATTGRVKVRVDASFGAIHIGDLLATSNVPGMARRSEPMDIGGRQFHQPGTIIGKALENLESGTGEILVLLSLQ